MISDGLLINGDLEAPHFGLIKVAGIYMSI